MKTLAHLVSFTMAIGGLVSIELPASATAADITGTWEVTIHYPPTPRGDYQATYVLKQDGEKITGTQAVENSLTENSLTVSDGSVPRSPHVSAP